MCGQLLGTILLISLRSSRTEKVVKIPPVASFLAGATNFLANALSLLRQSDQTNLEILFNFVFVVVFHLKVHIHTWQMSLG